MSRALTDAVRKAFFSNPVRWIVRHSDALHFRTNIRVCGMEASFGGVPKSTIVEALDCGRKRAERPPCGYQLALEVQVSDDRFCSRERLERRPVLALSLDVKFDRRHLDVARQQGGLCSR